MRRTPALVQIAIALMTDPTSRHWGYELSKIASVRSGALYPALGRMLERGWLTEGWEDETVTEGRRPVRRYYELSLNGRNELGALLRDARHDARFRLLIPGWLT